MHSKFTNRINRWKAGVLASMACGMLYASACTWGDLRLNVVNGTLSFVKGYTTDLWDAIFPAPGDLLSGTE